MLRLPRLVLKPLALLACVLWQSSPAQTQEADAPLQLRLSPRLAEKLSLEQRTASPTFVYGQRLSAETDTDIVFDGGVELRRAEMTIRADHLEYDQARDLARARGDVRVNQAGNVYHGPALELRIDAFEGFFDHASFRLLSNNAYGEAERIEFLDDSRSVVSNATFTTCQREPGPDWMPAWLLRAATLRLDSEDETAEAEDVTVRFQGVPVLGLSSMSFPLTENRKSGFLSPTFSVDNINGTEITVPYYWNIAPNRDLTLYPTEMSQRGVDYGGQFRYLEDDYSGQLRLDYMPDDKLRSRDRWGYSYQHNAALADNSYGQFGLKLNLNRVSDDNYWRDFSTPTLTQRLLTDDVALNWNQGAYSATVRTLKWQTLQAADSTIVPPYDRLPQVALRYAKPELGGFDVSLDADYTKFHADSALTGQPNAERTVLKGELSYPMRNAAGFIVPKVLVNAASYNFDAALSNGQTSASRTVPTVSLDSGLVFERDASYFGTGFRQTLEPRLFYVYTPYVEQNYLPNYDSGAMDFNFASIFSENAFVGNDRISDNNLLTTSLSSRLLDPDTGAEILRLGIAERLRFENQRIVLPGGTMSALKGVSDLLLGAGLTIDPRWYLDTTVQYNQKTGESERSTFSARYNPSDYRVINLAYRFQRDTSDLVAASELVDVGWQWPLNDLWGDRGQNLGHGQGQGSGRWYSVGRLNYSLPESKLADSIVGFEYDAGCWLGRIVYEHLSTGLVTSVRRIMFQLELVGFSRVGSGDPLQTLQKNIPRYQFLREQETSPSRYTNYE